jgi:hypothetical protein
MYVENTKRDTHYQRLVLSNATVVPISEVCINTVLVLVKEEHYKQVSGVVRFKFQDSRAKIHDNSCTN